ncbi:hypothetical protein IGI04_028448 [Brassica rapa subsp. trilocularis]|uniref:Uncharacterized protein n=1 Tax=Brassica rapa subsp. trilocularis TaxID=1813537 RepID=A0ABQ7L4B3_BRACM|nr:hypothetical protein IGI04_028448 [Brassica rapa subsp. trilocularis]
MIRGLLMAMFTSALARGRWCVGQTNYRETMHGRESELYLSIEQGTTLNSLKGASDFFKFAPAQEINENGSILQSDTTQRQIKQDGVCGSGVDEGIIPGMPVDNTVNIIQEVHINSLAVAIVCSQADAEATL